MGKLKELGIIAGEDYIGVGVGAVIVDKQGRILLGLRSGMVRNDVGKWDCPGGGGTPQEPLVKAIVRECQEEVDIMVHVGLRLPYIEQFTDNQHWISCAFLCEISSGIPKIMEPHKCVQLEWFTLDQAQTLPLTDTTSEIIRQLQELFRDTTPHFLAEA